MHGIARRSGIGAYVGSEEWLHRGSELVAKAVQRACSSLEQDKTNALDILARSLIAKGTAAYIHMSVISYV